MLALVPLALAVILFYGPQISPMLGMGPSSILSTGVIEGGFGPVPGYPVHNLISRLFLLMPFERPAYAMNMTSFAMAVLAILVFTRLLSVLLEYFTERKLHRLEIFTLGAVFSFLYFQSPALARISFFGDRYTTDLFFVALSASFFVDALLKPERLRRGLMAIAFFMTFIFFCHPKSVLLIWFFAAVLFFQAYRSKTRPPWLSMAGLFVLGFAIPVTILMVTSLRDPLFNWGTPNSFQNVLNSITRKEYGFIDLSREWEDGLRGWVRQYRILFLQFPAVTYAAAAVGLIFAFYKNRFAGFLLVAALLLTGEWISVVQHLKNPANDPALTKMFDWILLNYFGPYCALYALLACLGLSMFWVRLPELRRTRVVVLILIAALSAHAFAGRKNSYRDFGLSDELARNFEIVLPEGAVLFTNVDSVYSSLVHNQLHSGILKGRFILNTELMFRGWYYRDIERMYPAFWSKHEKILTEFRDLVLAFERAGYVQGQLDYKRYLYTLNSLAEDHMESGSYLIADPNTQALRPGSFTNLKLEPEALALRLVKGNFRISNLNLEGLSFENLKKRRVAGDIWAERFSFVFAYITEARLKRARVLENDEVPKLEKLLTEFR